MAIKGKKKSQSRGSQARRKPAMAPRPVTGKTIKPPWYKTTAGQTIASISALILIVVVLALVNNARTASEERERTQTALENYTDQVRALQQRIAGPATELSTAGTAPEPSEDLKDDATEWSQAFLAAQSEVTQFVSPPEASESALLFRQAMTLFQSAADTLVVAADLEGEQQTKLITTANVQITSASGVWDAAVGVLDGARDEADLSPAGVRSPATPGAVAPPPVPTAPASPEPGGTAGGGGSGGGGKGGGGKGKKGDGSDG